MPRDLSIAGAKAALRSRLLAARAGWRAAALSDCAALAARHVVTLLDTMALRPGPVSGYWPMGDEFDVRPTLEALAARGWSCALPATVGRAAPLAFRVWRPGEPLVPGGFGTSVPPVAAATVAPRVLLVPLLAFDRRGFRLGYGGGYYDRSLASLRRSGPVLAIGMAFAAQEIDDVPHDIHDQRLDAVATEAGVIRIAGA